MRKAEPLHPIFIFSVSKRVFKGRPNTRHCQFGKLTGVICLTNRKYGAEQWIVTPLRCTLLTKKVVPSKAEQGQWAIRLARKCRTRDWELPHLGFESLKCPTCFRRAWRIGSSCFEGQRSDGKGSTTYNVQRPSQCISMVDKHLFSLTRKSQLNLLPRLGTWRGDNQGLESEQEMSKNLKRAPPLKVDVQAHAHHLKDRSKRVRVDLTFQLPLFCCYFCQKQGNECLFCFVYDS